MSAKPMELAKMRVEAGTSLEVCKPVSAERRKRIRTSVHWPVLLFLGDHNAPSTVESVTEDLSSTGFYCLSRTPLRLGEYLSCTLRIPSNDPSGKSVERHLQCRVIVVRILPDAADGQYGIACRIEDYCLAESHPNF